jgi:Protein of unknown function (DUF3302)
MIDFLDIFAFVVFAVLIVTATAIVVTLGSLPGWIARQRNHPQAAAVNIASWLGMATGGILWPLALVWAFVVPSAPTQAASDQAAEKASLQARVESLETALRELNAGKQVQS